MTARDEFETVAMHLKEISTKTKKDKSHVLGRKNKRPEGLSKSL